MTSIALSLQQARNLHLSAQGLLTLPSKKATRAALRACIARMALLQIDTIHVVSRSPYLVLFSRLGAYPRGWLEEALAKGEIFETWAHEACFAPVDDLLRHRAYNKAARRHWGLYHAERTSASHRAQLDSLLQHIESKGPVKSSDFARTDGEGGGWWAWKDEKRWLETLFATGELMVARRENFHRVYDLAGRVAPNALEQESGDAPLNPVDVRQHFIERSVAALGVAQARWVNDYFRLKTRLKDGDLDALVEQGTLLRVAVEGWNSPGYVHRNQAAALKKAAAERLVPEHTALLSPFDPVVWDRERASRFFDFDYRIECYTPQAKRVYGYFVLPILCHGALIGRLDAKAHRAQGVFEVKAVYAQPGRVWDDAQIQAVALAIYQCAAWHDTPAVRVTASQPRGLRVALVRAIKNYSEGTP
jgi:uncharacterized protein YcaQ